jgi:hypothetical protein
MAKEDINGCDEVGMSDANVDSEMLKLVNVCCLEHGDVIFEKSWRSIDGICDQLQPEDPGKYTDRKTPQTVYVSAAQGESAMKV